MNRRQPTLIRPPDMNRFSENPYFTPWYLNNLLQANNYNVNAKVINHIRDLFPNKSFERIMRENEWANRILRDNNANQSMAYFNAMNPTFLYQGPAPNDLNHYIFHHNIPDETPAEPINRFRDDEYMDKPSGPIGNGLKKSKTNKWINHVKKYSKKHKVPYNIAIKEAKATYKA